MTNQNNAEEKAISAAITLLDGDLDHENAETMRGLLSKLPAPVTDLRPHLEWALRRIGTSLDTGDKYEAAQAALDAARAAPQASASNFAKLQSAYVGACDQLGELLASVPRASQSQHPDDIAVDSFAVAMKAKLAKKRAEGRGGWSDKSQCTAEFLSQLLHGHVDKGDPVDVGNLAMMLHQRGEAIAPAEDDGRDTAALQRLCDTLSKIVHNMVVAEQAAWIEWQHGQGAEAAMRWIGNGLAGPGHIPNEAEPYSKEAQAWYDANKADPFPVCPCGRPSNILHMGRGYCSTEHYNAAISTQHGAGVSHG